MMNGKINGELAIERVLDALADDLQRGWQATTPCPSEAERAAYLAAVRGEQEMGQAEWCVQAHVGACSGCYRHLLNQQQAEDRAAIEEHLGPLRRLLAKRPPNVIEQLTVVLQDQQRPAWVRAAAAEYLGELGDGRAQPALRFARNDDDQEVREAAQAALEQLTEVGVDQPEWLPSLAERLAALQAQQLTFSVALIHLVRPRALRAAGEKATAEPFEVDYPSEDSRLQARLQRTEQDETLLTFASDDSSLNEGLVWFGFVDSETGETLQEGFVVLHPGLFKPQPTATLRFGPGFGFEKAPRLVVTVQVG
jgi:hypothetical protein